MFEWNEATQKMIDWIEDNLTEDCSLQKISSQIGYSPFYCSTQFHQIVGMTIKSYISNRRLCKAALAIRDTNERIIDIAVKYGFSSQEALTRAFKSAYGCTPYAYRKNPRPIALSIKQVVLFPYHFNGKGEQTMSESLLTNANIRIEHIPAHKYLGIWDKTVKGYGDFWNNHNCDEVCGIIDSISHLSHPCVGPHMAGWKLENGERHYFYGLGVPVDYDNEIPKGFEIKEFPASYYMVFFHPTFDYQRNNEEVMGRVENLAWNFNPAVKGFAWNEKICQDYQRHYPEVLGYEVLRPVIKI